MIIKKYKDETHDAKLKFLRGSSDPVHVDKRIHANLANWYVIVGGFRVNLSILRNIREDEILGIQLRRILPLSSVKVGFYQSKYVRSKYQTNLNQF